MSVSTFNSENNLFRIIQREHMRIFRLCLLLEKTKGKTQRNAVFRQLRGELVKHCAAVEETVYPLFESLPQSREIILRGKREHSEIKELLESMEGGMASARFNTALQKLKKSVRAHVHTAECELFPVMRQHLPVHRLQQMGTELSRLEKIFPLAS